MLFFLYIAVCSSLYVCVCGFMGLAAWNKQMRIMTIIVMFDMTWIVLKAPLNPNQPTNQP